MKKEKKTIVSDTFDKWTVYATESTEHDGFIDFFAKKDGSSITHFVGTCQGSIDDVDEEFLSAVYNGRGEMVSYGDKHFGKYWRMYWHDCAVVDYDDDEEEEPVKWGDWEEEDELDDWEDEEEV